jgi:uncharacterized protein
MTASVIVPEVELRAAVTPVSARRIGVVGDDHNQRDDGADLPQEVFAAFDGVDLILHLGHMGSRGVLGRGVLDRLSALAPVLAVRDVAMTADGQTAVSPVEGDRVAGLARVVEAGGLRIGAVHSLATAPDPGIAVPPGEFPELAGVRVTEAIEKKFGGPVDVVAYAGSHRAAAILAGGVLFVNPGSPTYPRGPGRVAGQRALGTVGVLDVAEAVAVFEILELSLFS